MGILLSEEWNIITTILELKTTIPYKIIFDDGDELIFDVRLENFGNINGMLITTDYTYIKAKVETLLEMGYGYSCFTEPLADEVKRLKECITSEDIKLFKEILYD
ncbi:MAG: hypothetical protein WC484_08495, partial [Candidatus Omnitrophota bacterium]